MWVIFIGDISREEDQEKVSRRAPRQLCYGPQTGQEAGTEDMSAGVEIDPETGLMDYDDDRYNLNLHQVDPPFDDQQQLPPQTKRVMDDIRSTLSDIEGGRTADYPTLSRIMPQKSQRDGDTMCTPDCIHRQQNTRSYDPPRRLIADIRPPLPERLAVVEHEITDLNSIAATHQELLLGAASKEELNNHRIEAERRVASIHTRIDVEVLPEIRALGTRRFVRDWMTFVALTVSLIYSLLITFEKFAR